MHMLWKMNAKREYTPLMICYNPKSEGEPYFPLPPFTFLLQRINTPVYRLFKFPAFLLCLLYMFHGTGVKLL